jgi:hypothetical protein
MSDADEVFRSRVRAMSDDELIAAFNAEVDNRGWVSSRASFLAALRGEFKQRKFDLSALDDFSLRRKIKLVNQAVVPIPD